MNLPVITYSIAAAVIEESSTTSEQSESRIQKHCGITALTHYDCQIQILQQYFVLN